MIEFVANISIPPIGLGTGKQLRQSNGNLSTGHITGLDFCATLIDNATLEHVSFLTATRPTHVRLDSHNINNVGS